jgi:hypothetical protein
MLYLIKPGAYFLVNQIKFGASSGVLVDYHPAQASQRCHRVRRLRADVLVAELALHNQSQVRV